MYVSKEQLVYSRDSRCSPTISNRSRILGVWRASLLGGEVRLARLNSWVTPMKARSDSNVQIDRQSWAQVCKRMSGSYYGHWIYGPFKGIVRAGKSHIWTYFEKGWKLVLILGVPKYFIMDLLISILGGLLLNQENKIFKSCVFFYPRFKTKCFLSTFSDVFVPTLYWKETL